MTRRVRGWLLADRMVVGRVDRLGVGPAGAAVTGRDGRTAAVDTVTSGGRTSASAASWR